MEQSVRWSSQSDGAVGQMEQSVRWSSPSDGTVRPMERVKRLSNPARCRGSDDEAVPTRPSRALGGPCQRTSRANTAATPRDHEPPPDHRRPGQAATREQLFIQDCNAQYIHDMKLMDIKFFRTPAVFVVPNLVRRLTRPSPTGTPVFIFNAARSRSLISRSHPRVFWLAATHVVVCKHPRGPAQFFLRANFSVTKFLPKLHRAGDWGWTHPRGFS